MRWLNVIVPSGAYCIYRFYNYTPYWEYGNVYGKCYDCNDVPFVGDWIYAKIILEGAKHKDAEAAAGSILLNDIRTLDQLKAACCPPRLMSELLKIEAMAKEPLD